MNKNISSPISSIEYPFLYLPRPIFCAAGLSMLCTTHCREIGSSGGVTLTRHERDVRVGRSFGGGRITDFWFGCTLNSELKEFRFDVAC